MCQRGKYQPRRDIDPTSLEELAASIRNQGVMQPIILRAIASESAAEASYEIIAGERRWRAAQLVGLTTVPAVVKDVPDEAAMAMALVENIQREDLNSMEEAYALSRLNQEFGLTHQQVADIVGKSRAAVSNTLRLMSLHKDVKLLLENGDLEMGHARALLGLEGITQVNTAKEVVNRGLSVRQTEALVKSVQAPKAEKTTKNETEDPNISRLQTDLSDTLGVPVSFSHSENGRGKLTIKYNSLDELDGILEHIK
jgi:ParB family chromosome partitioning protein